MSTEAPIERPSVPRVAAIPLVAMSFTAVFMAVIVASAGSAPWRVARLGILFGLGVALVYAARRHQRIAAVPAVILGVIIASTCRAFGIQLQQAQGWSLLAVMGCVSYVCGLVLIGWGVWIATGGLRGGRRVLVAVIVLGIVKVVMLDSLVAPIADELALATGPRFELDGPTPAELGIPFESVTFLTPDGLELSGWYLPSENGAAVVLAHGASATRASVLRHAAVIAGDGYGVLLFDARGQGESEGVAMDPGWYGDADLSGAVTYVADRQDVEPSRVGVVRLSLGGEQAIGAAANDQRIRAVVAEGASFRVIDDWTPQSARGLLQRVRERITFATAAMASDVPPPSTLKQSVIDIAPPTGPADPIRCRHGDHRWPGDGCGVAVELEVWELPNAGHLGGLETEPAEWEQRVIEFLDANL